MNDNKIIKIVGAGAGCLVLIAICLSGFVGGFAIEQWTSPTSTPYPTQTPYPTATAYPTQTPYPTWTPPAAADSQERSETEDPRSLSVQVAEAMLASPIREECSFRPRAQAEMVLEGIIKDVEALVREPAVWSSEDALCGFAVTYIFAAPEEAYELWLNIFSDPTLFASPRVSDDFWGESQIATAEESMCVEGGCYAQRAVGSINVVFHIAAFAESEEQANDELTAYLADFSERLIRIFEENDASEDQT